MMILFRRRRLRVLDSEANSNNFLRQEDSSFREQSFSQKWVSSKEFIMSLHWHRKLITVCILSLNFMMVNAHYGWSTLANSNESKDNSGKSSYCKQYIFLNQGVPLFGDLHSENFLNL